MPVKGVRNESELEDALRTKTPLGYVVIYFFQDATGTHNVLSPVYEDISRKCPFSTFFSANADCVSDAALLKHNVLTLPTFLVMFGGEARRKFEVSTKEGLVAAMKKATVLPEAEQL
eukprot:TRINITY_DN11460_c0_g1_i1.p2 TRINITY_DN11460_c0_g1~~TRINITY_DN11460_c0_g1_i1.p2  ORF type:complete len:117 (-),score=11.19 TRINITY_DN11460_c0_g1_i1:41-391(-)